MRKKLSILLLTVSLVGLVSIVGSVRAAGDLFSEVNVFLQVYQIIQAKYIEEVSPDTLVTGAINGMLEALGDPRSRWLSAEEWEEWNVQKEGEFGGLGMKVGIRGEEITIVSVFEGTPAATQGLQAGDVIQAIDGKDTAGMTLDTAVSMLRGEIGTTVEVTIERIGTPEPMVVILTRALIQLPNVESRLLSGEVGYLRIIGFTNEHTARDVEITLRMLKDDGAQSIILDVRDNPGGLLAEAIDVADQFLASGTIVSVRGREESSDTHFSAHPNGAGIGLPLLVLINEASASASEIVAGAIKDNKRGILVGTHTFGKGTVQNAIPLADSGALWLTTAKYYTPSGVCIDGEGIEPDVAIEAYELPPQGQDTLQKLRTSPLITDFLAEHPQWTEQLVPQLLQQLAANEIDVGKDLLLRILREQDANKDNDILNDHQLLQALNLMTALPALQQPTATN